MTKNKHFQDVFQTVVSLDEGVYEYKYKVNDAWLTDPRKQVNSNANHILKVSSSTSIEYENFRQVRKEMLEYQKLMGDEFCELYIEGKNYDTTTIMRQSEDKKTYYYLISRNDFHNLSSEVSVTVELPGAIKEVKSIFYMDNGLESKTSEKELVGDVGKVIKCSSLNTFADIYTQFHFLLIKIWQTEGIFAFYLYAIFFRLCD